VHSIAAGEVITTYKTTSLECIYARRHDILF